MISALIFDFGNVFINLDVSGAMKNALEHFKISSLSDDIIGANNSYEKGLITTSDFLDFYHKKFHNLSNNNLIGIWNFMLLDFPVHRLKFIKDLKAHCNYRLILLSNTNELHIKWIQDHVSFYEEFKACFDGFYLSHEIGLSKPSKEIYKFVLSQHKLKPEECFFIDDSKDNVMAAAALGIKTWHINPDEDDVSDLFKVYPKLAKL